MFYILNYLKRKLFPTSLLPRFILIIVIPILIGQLLAVYLFYQRHWYNVAHHTSELLTKEISSLIERKDYDKTPQKKNIYLNLQYEFIPNSELPSLKKKRIYTEELEIFRKALNKEIHQKNIVSLDKNGSVKLYIEINNDILQIKLPSKSLITPTTYIFVLWIILLTILLLSISLIFSKNQIKSIIDLANAAQSYGRGDKTYSYTPSGAKEIRYAGLAFLKMKDRIERQVTKRTQMLAMISHDLKTPLTRMKLQVELMENSEEKEELSYDIKTMQHMIESYLGFAKGEGGEEFKKIKFNQWIKEYIQNRWANNDISINLAKNDIYIQIKQHSFERAITNLIDNAFKYATKVKISLYSLDNNSCLIIEDNGSGIKKENRKLVFKPFYREDSARSLDHCTSVGLGLAITKEIIINHNGTITLEDSKELKGLLVKVQIPMAK